MCNGVLLGYSGQTEGTFCGKMRVETAVSSRDLAYFRLRVLLFLLLSSVFSIILSSSVNSVVFVIACT